MKLICYLSGVLCGFGSALVGSSEVASIPGGSTTIWVVIAIGMGTFIWADSKP